MEPSPPAVSLHDLSFEALAARLAADGLRPVHAISLWRILYRHMDTDPRARADLLPPLKRWLDAHLGRTVGLTEARPVREVQSSDGRTRKILLQLRDGQQIETVVMGYPGRFTACLSSQAGCAMGCVFCATGQMGFVRHLSPGEILVQILEAQRRLRAEGNALRNLVMMGMGEPFHNYDAVMQALASASRTPGLGMGPARISVSTVGVVPGIIRYADERQPYSLIVSLHAATDAERSALLPVNLRWPLKELLEACRYYSKRSGERVFFGWTLIAGRNDSPGEARRVVELLRGLNAHLNLIRLNPTPDFDGQSPEEAAACVFRETVRAGGIPCTIRQFRGIDVAAGCGQLRSEKRRPVSEGGGQV